jgi:hypothetical protein
MHEFLNLQRTQLCEQQKQTHRHRRIANASQDECLTRRPSIRGVAVPEADQQITAQPDAFPPEIEK